VDTAIPQGRQPDVGEVAIGGPAYCLLPTLGSHRTLPLVFLSTEAAKLWVTPTRLVPSTSTRRSFTWILGSDIDYGVMKEWWRWGRRELLLL
jgi:hypothetical protein